MRMSCQKCRGVIEVPAGRAGGVCGNCGGEFSTRRSGPPPLPAMPAQPVQASKIPALVIGAGLAGCLVLLLACTGVVSVFMGKTPLFSGLDAHDLVMEFRNDAIRADKKYGDKFITVTGTVSFVTYEEHIKEAQDAGRKVNYFIILRGGVRCDWPEGVLPTRHKEGDRVTVCGKCRNFGPTIFLYDCR